MASIELGVSYRQSGSDTKPCDTPIQVIEISPILAPGTRAMGQLDKQRQDQYISMAADNDKVFITQDGEAFPSRHMRTRQYSHYLCNMNGSLYQSSWQRQRR